MTPRRASRCAAEPIRCSPPCVIGWAVDRDWSPAESARAADRRRNDRRRAANRRRNTPLRFNSLGFHPYGGCGPSPGSHRHRPCCYSHVAEAVGSQMSGQPRRQRGPGVVARFTVHVGPIVIKAPAAAGARIAATASRGICALRTIQPNAASVRSTRMISVRSPPLCVRLPARESV